MTHRGHLLDEEAMGLAVALEGMGPQARKEMYDGTGKIPMHVARMMERIRVGGRLRIEGERERREKP